jgi:hypothetical protein
VLQAHTNFLLVALLFHSLPPLVSTTKWFSWKSLEQELQTPQELVSIFSNLFPYLNVLQVVALSMYILPERVVIYGALNFLTK